MSQVRRINAFRELIADYGMTPDEYDAGEEEDPRPYLSGEEPIAQYVCVTVNYTSHGHEKYFFLPVFAERDAAELRAVEFARDDLFEELPVAVVDLDSGVRWLPNWNHVPWKEAK